MSRTDLVDRIGSHHTNDLLDAVNRIFDSTNEVVHDARPDIDTILHQYGGENYGDVIIHFEDEEKAEKFTQQLNKLLKDKLDEIENKLLKDKLDEIETFQCGVNGRKMKERLGGDKKNVAIGGLTEENSRNVIRLIEDNIGPLRQSAGVTNRELESAATRARFGMDAAPPPSLKQ